MRVLIVEDENLLAKQLVNLVEQIEPGAKVVGRTTSIVETQAFLSGENPDLILMDIELADGQCFDLFNRVKISTPVIFTTAYDEHTLKAFKVNSIDYLLKPIQAAELKAAFDKYRYIIKLPQPVLHMPDLAGVLQHFRLADSYKSRFLVRSGHKMLTILTSEIYYFTSSQKINYLVTDTNQKYLSEHTLDDLETRIDPKRFFRINRQFLVAQPAIKAIYPWFKGRLKIELRVSTDDEMLVSRERVTAFKSWLEH